MAQSAVSNIPCISMIRPNGIKTYCFSPRSNLSKLTNQPDSSKDAAEANVYVYVKDGERSASPAEIEKQMSDDVGKQAQDSSRPEQQDLGPAGRTPNLGAQHEPGRSKQSAQTSSLHGHAKQQIFAELLNQQMAQLEQRNRQLETNIHALEQQLKQTCKQHKQGLQEVTKQHKQEMEAVGEQHKQRMQELQAVAEQHQQRIQQLQALSEERQQQLEAAHEHYKQKLQEAGAQHEQQVQAMQQAAAETQADLQKLQMRVAELQDERSFVDRQLQLEYSASTKLKQRLEECQAQLQDLQRKNAHKDAKVEYAIQAAVDTLELSISLQEPPEQQQLLQLLQEAKSPVASLSGTATTYEDWFAAAAEAALVSDEDSHSEGAAASMSEAPGNCSQPVSSADPDGPAAAESTAARSAQPAFVPEGYGNGWDARGHSAASIQAVEKLLSGGWDSQWAGAAPNRRV